MGGAYSLLSLSTAGSMHKSKVAVHLGLIAWQYSCLPTLNCVANVWCEPFQQRQPSYFGTMDSKLKLWQWVFAMSESLELRWCLNCSIFDPIYMLRGHCGYGIRDIVPNTNKQSWGTVSYSSQLSHWTQTRALNTDGNAMLPQFLKINWNNEQILHP